MIINFYKTKNFIFYNNICMIFELDLFKNRNTETLKTFPLPKTSRNIAKYQVLYNTKCDNEDIMYYIAILKNWYWYLILMAFDGLMVGVEASGALVESFCYWKIIHHYFLLKYQYYTIRNGIQIIIKYEYYIP